MRQMLRRSRLAGALLLAACLLTTAAVAQTTAVRG